MILIIPSRTHEKLGHTETITTTKEPLWAIEIGQSDIIFRNTDINQNRTPPCNGNVQDCAEEEEHDELGEAALHGNILRHIFPSPAAFGAAG